MLGGGWSDEALAIWVKRRCDVHQTALNLNIFWCPIFQGNPQLHSKKVDIPSWMIHDIWGIRAPFLISC